MELRRWLPLFLAGIVLGVVLRVDLLITFLVMLLIVLSLATWWQSLDTAQAECPVPGTQESGVLPHVSAPAGLDVHVRRQAVVGAVEQLGDGRTQKRVGPPPILGIAPLDSRDSRGMVFVLGRHAANQRQLVGDRCSVGDQFAEMDSGKLGRD